MVQRLGRHAVRRVGLDHHAVELRETVEVRDVLSSVIARYGCQHVRRRDARPLAPRGIDVERILRVARRERRISRTDFGPCGECRDESARRLVQFGDGFACLVLHVQLEAVYHAVARNHGRCGGENLRIGNLGRERVDAVDDRLHVVALAGAFRPVAERKDDHARARTRTAERIAAHGGVVLDLRHLLNLLFELRQHAGRGVERRAGLGGDADHDRSGVLVGNQSRLRVLHQDDEQHDGRCEHSPRHEAVAHEPDDAAHIALHHDRKGGVECLAEPSGEVLAHVALLVHIGLQHQGAQRGRKRQGVDGRKTDGNGHRDAELRVEDTRRAAHHRHGNEDGHENERRGDDRARDALHGVVRGHVGRFVAHVETRLHGLDHHDGVIDHRTDGEHEGEQR